jgi:hypothetical protein
MQKMTFHGQSSLWKIILLTSPKWHNRSNKGTKWESKARRLPEYSLSRSQIIFIYMLQGDRKILCRDYIPPESLLSRPFTSRILAFLEGSVWITVPIEIEKHLCPPRVNSVFCWSKLQNEVQRIVCFLKNRFLYLHQIAFLADLKGNN